MIKRRVGNMLTPIKVQAHRPGNMWGFATMTTAAALKNSL
jgi:hypothetical protein